MPIRRMMLLAGVAGLFVPAWTQAAPLPDCTQAYFSPESKVVLESAGKVVLKVSNPGSDDRVRTVDYRTIDGTAASGVDYVGESGTLSFSPSATIGTIDIAIMDDAAVEPNTQFKVELIPVQDSCITDVGGNATVTIKENDSVAEEEPPPGGDDPRPGTTAPPGSHGTGSGGSGSDGSGGSGSGSGGSGTPAAGSNTFTPTASLSPGAPGPAYAGSNDGAFGLPPYPSTIAAPSVEQDGGGVTWSALAGIALGGIALGGLWVGSAARRKAATRPPS